ncbi:MAG: nucleotide sugar dehydrogenase [candidate division KSB1 bacterium]|jgi:UDP-N-acetyl-D-glucosamine dehydrogenase|nr:nucleotide sugar dehydrogenase [candidate division KSB1 bacterium]
MSLEQRLKDHSAKIGIIGLGYVGLPLAVEYADKGFQVIGIDTDGRKVSKINFGENYISDVDDDTLRRVVKEGKLSATTTYDAVRELDAIYICVPTPFNVNKDPDISYIINSAEGVLPGLRKGQVIILKSTTFPETTEKVVLPILESSGLKVGDDFNLAFSPERIDPGRTDFTTKNTPVVVGGVTEKCTEMASLVITQVVSNVHVVSSPKVAEMEKLLENIFRSVNIALVNELARLCDRMGGIDIWEVVEAAATKPFGFMPFYPGPGIGGHCILVDPYYMAWKAREYDFHTSFIELAAKVNEDMPFYVAGLIRKGLSNIGRAFKDANILMLGVSFKENIDDTRNSPALSVLKLLLKRGAKNISYNDPYVPEVHLNGMILKSEKLTQKLLQSQDVVVITAKHNEYDAEFIVNNSKVIVDTRNLTKNIKDPGKIIKLGEGEPF